MIIIDKGFKTGDLSDWDSKETDFGDLHIGEIIINGYRIPRSKGKVLIVHGFIQTPFRMFRLRLKIWWQDKILRRKEITVRIGKTKE